MSKQLYMDVSAKIVIETEDSFSANDLKKEITVLNKGNVKGFEVTNCLVHELDEIDAVNYYNLKSTLDDDGEVTENKYSNLSKDDVVEIKKDLKNLFKILNAGNQAPVFVSQNINKMIKMLEEVE